MKIYKIIPSFISTLLKTRERNEVLTEASAQLERPYLDLIELLKRARSGEAVPSDFRSIQEVQFDGRAEWVTNMLDRKKIHEPDFAAFGLLPKQAGTILDVGANYGYSVGSIRAAGCDNPILSIEVLSGYRDSLEKVKEHLGHGYDYVISGVGVSEERLTFYTPVVGILAVTALTTARVRDMSDSDILSLARTVDFHIKSYPSAHYQDYRVGLLRTEAKVEPLDRILANYRGEINVSRILAIKIDVEGLEDAVVAGAIETVRSNLPLLMLESGNRNRKVRNILEGLGYLAAEYIDGNFVATRGETTMANGFFIHPDGVVPDGFRFLTL